MALTLYIGNKNYSSWSMRPWVLMKQAGIAFTENKIRFDSFEADSNFKKTILNISPAGKVPVLVDSHLGEHQAIWDSLAISEYVAETHPQLQLWPQDVAVRARARVLCADMHSGFQNLRSHCPMNIEASLPDMGAQLLAEHANLRDDLQRIITLWQNELSQHGGPMLFGNFSIADAFFAPVCMRINTYALPVPADVQAYVDRITALPSVSAWIQDALAEKDFRAFEEPFRSQAQ